MFNETGSPVELDILYRPHSDFYQLKYGTVVGRPTDGGTPLRDCPRCDEFCVASRMSKR